jgi:uncharacterized protein involved in exopolysaccharide biosynthesis
MKSKTVKVLLALVLCPAFMLVMSMILPKRYTATMSLMLDESLRVAQMDSPMSPFTDQTGFSRPRSISTQVDEITGTEVLLDAINKTAAQHPNAFSDQQKAADRYMSLVNRLRIDNNKDSDIVDLSVTMDDPQLAADTANNIGQAYMDLNKKLSSAMGGGALANINDALTQKQKELNDINAKIAAIQHKYNISDPQAAGGMQDRLQKDTEAQIQSTESQLTGAEGEMASAQQSLRSTPQYLQSTSDVQLNPKIMDLDAKISQTSSDLQALRAKYTDNYPQVKQLSDKLADLQRERATTPQNIVGHVSKSLNPNWTQFQSAYAQAQAKVQNLQASLATLRGNYSKILSEGSVYPAAQQQLAQLILDKQSAEQNYQMLMQQKEPLKVTNGSAREAQAQIISVALAPGQPSFPNSKVFVLMGLAIGIIISALIVMPKAPDVMYAPTGADVLALNGSIQAPSSSLPGTDPGPAARPAMETGNRD